MSNEEAFFLQQQQQHYWGLFPGIPQKRPYRNRRKRSVCRAELSARTDRGIEKRWCDGQKTKGQGERISKPAALAHDITVFLPLHEPNVLAMFYLKYTLFGWLVSWLARKNVLCYTQDCVLDQYLTNQCNSKGNHCLVCSAEIITLKSRGVQTFHSHMGWNCRAESKATFFCIHETACLVEFERDWRIFLEPRKPHIEAPDFQEFLSFSDRHSKVCLCAFAMIQSGSEWVGLPHGKIISHLHKLAWTLSARYGFQHPDSASLINLP